MATKQVAVTLVGKDNLSPTFKKVGASATAAGKEIDAAGKSVSRLDAVGTKLSKTGAAVGGALAAMTGILADAARAAAEADVSNERLRASIEATGATYEEYAQQLEAAGEAAVQMGFDDEDAADSISRLTQSTGDAGRAIEDLSLIMDVARGRGISLAEATRIVEAAETGRIGTLARLGIVLDANASREEALAALQQRYAGQAQAYAETTMGFYDRVSVKLGNLYEDLGAHTGALQTVLVLLPGLSAGWTAASAALGGLSNMLGITTANAAAFAKTWGKAGILGVIAFGLYELEQSMRNTHMEAIFDEFGESAEALDNVLSELAANGEADLLRLGDATNAITDQMLQDFNKWSDLVSQLDAGKITESGREELARLSEIFGTLGSDIDDFSQLEGAVARILANSGAGAQLAADRLAFLNEQYASGKIDAAMYWEQVVLLSNSLDRYNREATLAEQVTNRTNAAMFRASEGTQQLAEDWKQVVLEFQRGELEKKFDAVTSAYTATTNALDNGFRVLVSNTTAIGQNADAVFQWAEELIAAEGTYSKLDDLLASGAITQRDYARAQEAYNQIAIDNAAIQEDILAIQAKQAPIVAQLMSDQAAYWDALADQPADVQRLALAYMDTATSAQALALAQAAMAGTPGLEPLIAGAIQANPLLEAILEDMGIISVGTDGTITIHTEGQSEMESLISTMQTLTQSIWIARFGGDIAEAEAAYNDAFGLAEDWDNSEPQATIAADNSDAQEGFDAAETWFSSWDGSTATAKANVDDNASGTLGSISAMLAAIDGTVATSYINVVTQKIGGQMDGGTTPLGLALAAERQAANGMTTTLVGERGPELLMLPGGAQVMNTEATRSRTGSWGGAGVHIHIGNLYGDETLAERVSAEIVPAVVRALAQRGRGF